MAKKAILDVLESTIGRYVENLDAKSLNVAVWSGKVKLSSLQLNVKAVNDELARKAAEAPNLAIPLRVVEGKFASMEVDVPWARLTSRPVVFRAKGLHVLLEPHDHLAGASVDVGLAGEEKRKAARAESLESAENGRGAMKKLAALDVSDGGGGSDADAAAREGATSGASFGERLVRRVVENLQFDVDDVRFTLRGQDSSAGVVLDSFSLVTTDKDGQRTFVDRSSGSDAAVDDSFIYKMLHIGGFGIYCNDDSTRRLQAKYGAAINRGGANVAPEFILSPLSLQVKLRQSDLVRCVDFPKYLLTSELSSLSILLSRRQLELLHLLALAVAPNHNVARPLFPEYRPSSPVSKKTVKLWWNYARRCIGRLTRRRSWTELFLAFQKRRRFVALYKRATYHAEAAWLKPLNDEEQEQLDTITDDPSISVEGIMMWRSLADAQYDKEAEKKREADEAKKTKDLRSSNKGFFSLFGKSSSSEYDAKDDADDAPLVNLSAEEMNELERMADDHSSDMSALSDDSILCDLQFALHSFKVNLISHTRQPVAFLHMGRVESTFVAQADGAFDFDFAMSSFQVDDMVTPNSYFRSVVQSLQAAPPGTEGASSPPLNTPALGLKMKKSKTGDRDLKLNMVAFQIVASATLVRETKTFFTLSNVVPASQEVPAKNAMLQESAGGSVNLFYDAQLGASTMKLNAAPVGATAVAVEATSAAASAVSNQLSAAIADAWTSKKQMKGVWSVDCDIAAPIFVLPESCVARDATVLVFDLGHFKFVYGKAKAVAPEVDAWLKKTSKSKLETFYDQSRLEMENLTFVVGTAGKESSWSNTSSSSSSRRANAVIQPISLALDVGIEQTTSATDPSRTCVMGVLPSITMNSSLSQMKKILKVVNTWTKVLDDVSDESPEEGTLIVEEEADPIALTKQEMARRKKTPSAPLSSSGHVDFFHMFVSFRRCSAHFMADVSGSIDAHLVSVTASVTKSTDGSVAGRLRMGWFWVLDGLECKVPRRQRLLIHSKLPRSADEYAADGSYKILEDLSSQGVFDDAYSSASDLADVVVRQCSLDQVTDDDDKRLGKLTGAEMASVVDADFYTLFVNWNPSAIRQLMDIQAALLQTTSGREVSASSPKKGHMSTSMEPAATTMTTPDSEAPPVVILKVRMKGFEVSLKSARDDLPLFDIVMAGTTVNMQSASGNNMEVKLEVGDIRVETPPNSRALPGYQTALGLSQGQSKSLLTVVHAAGKEAIQPYLSQGIGGNKFQSISVVELSPMRLVFLQARIMALTDYLNDGILGALVASSAASAANLANEGTNEAGEAHLILKGTALEIICPQAAYDDRHFRLQIPSLDVNFRSFPALNGGGGQGEVQFRDVTVDSGHQSEHLLKSPVHLGVTVLLPKTSATLPEDKALRTSLSLSEAAFILPQRQYAQLMRTLQQNMGEVKPFVREDEGNPGPLVDKDESDGQPVGAHEPVSHSGVVVQVVHNRLYTNVQIGVLTIELCGGDSNDPIISLAAVETAIALSTLPDEAKTVMDVTLRNLLCDDRRKISEGRQFRRLIDNVVDDDATGSRNLFRLIHSTSLEDGAMETELTMGTPRIVVLPDVVGTTLEFLNAPSQPDPVPEVAATTQDPTEIVLRPSDDGDGIEASVEALKEPEKPINSKFRIKTGEWTIVLADLGAAPPGQSNQAFVGGKEAESFVFQSKMTANVKWTASGATVVGYDLELHAEAAELFTAQGEALTSQIEVVAPVSVSTFITMATKDNEKEDVDIRLVGLTDIAVSFSMQNAALLHSIASSLNELTSGGSEEMTIPALTDEEVARIERLNSALAKEDDSKTGERSSTISMTTADSSLHLGEDDAKEKSRTICVRLTLPSVGCTIINDLFGQQAALLRFAVKNFVCRGEHDSTGASNSSKIYDRSTFFVNLNTSIEADYFDPRTNLWESLLVKPWELAFKGQREAQSKTERMNTNFDLESHPCYVSFSEQFLVSLGAAIQMWSIYSAATTNAVKGLESGGGSGEAPPTASLSLRKKMAATAARSLLDSLPYTLENNCGLSISFTLDAISDDGPEIPSGSARSFRFQRRQRLFGQDVREKKAVYLYVCGETIFIPDVDAEVVKPQQAHFIGEGRIVLTEVRKRGKTTVVYVSSQVEVTNTTCLPVEIAVILSTSTDKVGECEAVQLKRQSRATQTKTDGSGLHNYSKDVRRTVGIPIEYLGGLDDQQSGDSLQPSLVLQLSSRAPTSAIGFEDSLGTASAVGRVQLPSRGTLVGQAAASSPQISELVCTSETATEPSITFQVQLKVLLVDNYPVVRLSLRPRSVVENLTPINMLLRTPMPNTYSAAMGNTVVDEWHVQLATSETSLIGQTLHRLEPFDHIEIYTPGPSVALSFMSADPPTGGCTSSWIDEIWIDLPLGERGLLPEPIRCLLPFTDQNGRDVGYGLGAEVYLAESSHVQQHLIHDDDVDSKKDGTAGVAPPTSGFGSADTVRRVHLTVKNFVVDHTGTMLVEQVHDLSSSSGASAIVSAYSSSRHNRRISLLPRSQAALRLMQLSMDESDGMRKSMPFLVEHVGLSSGGIGSTPVMWANNTPSGYFAYRALNAFDQTELHIIPEFVVFNGGSDDIAIKETQGHRMLVKAGRMVPVYSYDKKIGLILMIDIVGDSGSGSTAPIRVDKLGTQVCVVRSGVDHSPLGSLTVQTVMGSRESRLVVKVGGMRGGVNGGSVLDIFPGDSLRMRVRWTELQVMLNDTERLGSDYSKAKGGENALATSGGEKVFQAYEPVTKITFHRFTIDFQRIFKAKDAESKWESSERSQIALIVHSVQIVDCTPGTLSPVVLDLPSEQCHFIDLCIRTRGPLASDLIRIDLFDLNLAYAGGKSHKVIVDTGEDFVWRLVDIMNRTSEATAELSGVDVDLEWNEATGQYNVSVLQLTDDHRAHYEFDIEENYQPPDSDQFFDVKALRVSPVSLLVSFRRRPHLARYPAEFTSSKFGNLLNHFLSRLKFNIEKADLSFSGYMTKSIRGSSERLVEIVGAVYMSQIKLKLITLLTAVSVQDWRFLTSRQEGGDEFLEGDILRMTGNIVGRGSHFLVKKAGLAVGDGLSTLAGSLGDGIQNAAESVGAGKVGRKVNNAVSGIGEGVGTTVKGVSSGAGTVLKETGKGVGQIAGGFGGGVLLAGKGIGKAVKDGDASAVVTGFGEGIAAVGTGVGQGVETAVLGAADGVLSAGKGLVSGVKIFGKGLTGRYKKDKDKKGSG